ncbi:hypothetical protein CPB86DRAFT_730969 [Serendipita vermifera]|nr:hypothetical protein CPB86DRAFT_730969 [Serendipita vermifera]
MSHIQMTKDDIIQSVNNLYLSRLFANVATTFVLYDTFLVINTELQTIWSSKWTLPKCLYLYIRVVTPVGLFLHAYELSDIRPALSDEVSFCRAWMSFEAAAMLTSLIFANALFTLRLIALYRRRPWFVWFIRIFYIASYIACFTFIVITQKEYSAGMFYSEMFRVCSPTTTSMNMPITMPAIFFAPASYEAFIFGLTTYRAWKDSAAISTSGGTPFLTLLYRDGLIAFFVMVSLRIWNVWIFFTQPLSSFNMGTPLMWSANAVLTARVYLNLVWLARRPLVTVNETTEGFNTGAGISASIHLKVRPSATTRADTWQSSGVGRHAYTIPTLDMSASHDVHSSQYPSSSENIRGSV